ncbi:MAG: acyl-ACP--UDP-N-acetylglucosamine O-acyltransferase [Elusimicrobiota bacterium]
MSENLIHSTAVLEGDIDLGNNVQIGPFCLIRGNISIGDNTTIDARTVVEGNTVIGKNNNIGIGAVIGNPPQDLKYDGEPTRVVIGDSNNIREYVTINRGTEATGTTRLGDENLLMSYVHIAHDCHIEDEVIFANCATLGGHINIESKVVIGGMTAIHQFTKIGKIAMIGGASRVTKDIPPFCRVAGNPLKLFGLNSIGLKRRDFSSNERSNLKSAYKILFNEGLNTTQALEKLKNTPNLDSEHVEHLIEFIEKSDRGIIKE